MTTRLGTQHCSFASGLRLFQPRCPNQRLSVRNALRPLSVGKKRLPSLRLQFAHRED